MFSSSVTDILAREHACDLHDSAAAAGARPVREASPEPSEVTVRLAVPGDARALERLAQLDSRRLPAGDVLVAEVAGELRAAVGLIGGTPMADPFHPTAALVSLLSVRAEQLRSSLAPQAVRRTRRRRLVAVPNR